MVRIEELERQAAAKKASLINEDPDPLSVAREQGTLVHREKSPQVVEQELKTTVERLRTAGVRVELADGRANLAWSGDLPTDIIVPDMEAQLNRLLSQLPEEKVQEIIA